MFRVIFAALAVAILAMPGSAAAQSQGELEFLQRRTENIRDSGIRRAAHVELEAAREALRQNNAAEFKQRGNNILLMERRDEARRTR